jgi:hypothetical protein
MRDHLGRRIGEKFELDWKLPRRDELAIAIRISLTRRGVTWGENLHTDEQWAEMADEIIETLETDH